MNVPLVKEDLKEMIAGIAFSYSRQAAPTPHLSSPAILLPASGVSHAYA